MFFYVTSEILRLFVTTLTANDKYSLRNKENLPQTNQMQLSKKQFFFEFLAKFLKFASFFEHFQKNYDPLSICISEIRNCKRRG